MKYIIIRLFVINIVVMSVSVSFLKANRLLLKEIIEGEIMVQNKPKVT